MNWWAYVQLRSGGAPNAHIAEAIGITPPSVGRWAKPGARPDPAQAAAFARAYNRPVLEAFIAAGFLTADEADQQPSAPPTLATLDDDTLLAEIRTRMRRGESDAHADAHAEPQEKMTPAAPTANIRPLTERQARKPLPTVQNQAARTSTDKPDEGLE